MGKPEKTKEIKEKIQKLRSQGKSLSEISKILNRSVYFVYSRLNSSYEPEKRLEIDYVESKVIPYLKNKGFKEVHVPEGDFQGDIVAKKGNSQHIFEVKKDPQKSLLCYAIGEIILGRRVNEGKNKNNKYHIILPKPKKKDIEKELKRNSNYLKKNYNIDIIFI